MPYQAQILQLLIENARDYAIVMLDAEGCIILWNTGAENVLGWQEFEIVGQTAASFSRPKTVWQAILNRSYVPLVSKDVPRMSVGTSAKMARASGAAASSIPSGRRTTARLPENLP